MIESSSANGRQTLDPLRRRAIDNPTPGSALYVIGAVPTSPTWRRSKELLRTAGVAGERRAHKDSRPAPGSRPLLAQGKLAAELSGRWRTTTPTSWPWTTSCTAPGELQPRAEGRSASRDRRTAVA